MLLLLLSGSGPAPAVLTGDTAFQASAFQTNVLAFQIFGAPTPPPPTPPSKPHVGWFDEWDIGRRFRHDPEELERRLEAQRASTRVGIEKLLLAELEVRKPKVKRAIRQAVIAAIEAGTVAAESPIVIDRLDELLANATAAAQTARALKTARAAERTALALIAAIAEDEEEEEFLLLWS